jgi:hypothetical protein
MSILNLNTPQGQGPAGKKKVKIWMGVGLLVAVLGIGSTFAANITLNSPAGTSEFGQGVTQTVYCGGNQSVTITPISTYQNTVKNADTPAVDTVTISVGVLNQFWTTGSPITVSSPSTYRVTISSKTSSSAPRWGSSVSNSTTTGFLLSSPTSSSNSAILPSSVTSSGTYYFAPEISTNSGTYLRVYNSSNTDLRQVIWQLGTPLVTGSVVSAATFKVGGVVISNIPPACAGVDFVVKSYAATGDAQTLISSGSDVVKEAASIWTASSDAITPSKDRSTPISTPLLTASQTGTSLRINFVTSAGTGLGSSDLYKLIVETQQDSLT